ncbi:MAG: O-antigen ligase family protein [Planctomycetota bacterium]
MSESFERLELSFLAALPIGDGPSPATTAWLDFIVLTASVAALVRRGVRAAGRAAGAGLILLLAAVVVSSSAAGDKPLALLAGSSLFSGALGGVALYRLVQTRWMLHVLIAALLATGVTSAARCIRQSTLEATETIRLWEEEQKPELVRQGVDVTDPVIVNFERRMRAREAYAFLAHPNIAGSALMMWLVAAAGLLAQALSRLVRGRTTTSGDNALRASSTEVALPVVLSAILGGLLAAGLLLTGSRGAELGALAGLLALLLLGRQARRIASRARTVVAMGFTAYLGVIALGAGYGLVKGTLPGASLGFRWQYWTAGAQAYAEAPLTGLGRQNFAVAYMRHKSPESTEEVRDPHNLWVSLLVELGPLGLAGGALLITAAVAAAMRNLSGPKKEIALTEIVTHAPSRAHTAVAPHPATGVAYGRAALLAAGVLGVQAAASATPFGEPGILLLWVFEQVAVPWLAGYVLVLWVLSRTENTDADRRWLAAGLTAAVIAALVHGLVDFALLTPAGLAVFVLTAAGAARMHVGGMVGDAHPTAHPAMVGDAHPTATATAAASAGPERMRPVALAAVGLVLIAGHAAAVVVPTTRNTYWQDQLEAALREPPPAGPQHVAALLERMAVETWDAAAARAAARAALEIANWPGWSAAERIAWLTRAAGIAEIAIARNPQDSNGHVLAATIDEQLAHAYAELGRTAETAKHRRAAAEAWERAVARYPTDPRTRISAGKAWLEIWQVEGPQRTGTSSAEPPRAAECAERARGHFARALQIDDVRPPGEVMRLRPTERRAADAALRQLAAQRSELPKPP